MKDFCVIGSGISGSTIANLLKKKYSVDLYDKARGPGGRSSFKRLKDKIGFDHGTQYISPKSEKFKRFVNQLIKKKVLKKWGGRHLFLNTQKKEDKKHIKIIGAKGNNDISKYLLKNIKCHFNKELKKIEKKNKKWVLSFSDGDKKQYSNLILTCPFPQLKKLSKKIIQHSFLEQRIKMDANITVMISLNKKINTVSSYFFDDPILGWAANENTKNRFKTNKNLWTLQSTYKWANKHINNNRINKNKNSQILIKKFFNLLKIKDIKPKDIINHGWKYSSNSKPPKINSYWNSSLKIGACGDWFVGPRLESGWISAMDLYKKIIYS